MMELVPVFGSGLLLLGVCISTLAEIIKSKGPWCTIFTKMGDVLVGGTLFFVASDCAFGRFTWSA